MQSAATMESIRSMQNGWHILWRKLTSSLRETPGIQRKDCQRSSFLSGYRAWNPERICGNWWYHFTLLGIHISNENSYSTLFFFKGMKNPWSRIFCLHAKNWAEGNRLNIPQAAELESLHSLIAPGHVGMKLWRFELQASITQTLPAQSLGYFFKLTGT